MTSPNLALPLLYGAQARKRVTVQDALSRPDGRIQLSVKDRNLGQTTNAIDEKLLAAVLAGILAVPCAPLLSLCETGRWSVGRRVESVRCVAAARAPDVWPARIEQMAPRGYCSGQARIQVVEMKINRRNFLGAAALAVTPGILAAKETKPFRLGLTPVFLDNDAAVIERLQIALSGALGTSVKMEQRRTYKEVTEMLLEGALDAAWLCGYPYLQHRDALSLVAVPVWNGKPLYRSYLIVGSRDDAGALADLEGDVHAFSDPDSNSGYLVTASDLAMKGLRAEEFFGRTIFTYGHRNVVRAVSSGLVRSGSVDGYVWEALARMEPTLTAGTRVISRSEWLGFPPVCARSDRMQDDDIQLFQKAVLDFGATADGRAALDLLQLDGMTSATPALFDGIARRMQILNNLR